MVKVFKLTVGAGPTRLSDVYGDGVGVVNPANDIPYRQLVLQAETADVKLGDSAVTVSNNFGVNLPFTAPAGTLTLGPYDAGPLKLSDFYAISTSATLHILGIPY